MTDRAVSIVTSMNNNLLLNCSYYFTSTLLLLWNAVTLHILLWPVVICFFLKINYWFLLVSHYWFCLNKPADIRVISKHKVILNLMLFISMQFYLNYFEFFFIFYFIKVAQLNSNNIQFLFSEAVLNTINFLPLVT